MHFEHLVLKALSGAATADDWSIAMQTAIGAVTGDDAAMAVLGVGADLAEFRGLLAPRLAVLENEIVGPLDQLGQDVREAEQALEAARRQRAGRDGGLLVALPGRTTSSTCGRPTPTAGGEPVQSDGPPPESVRTPVDGPADGVEERPDDEDAHLFELSSDAVGVVLVKAGEVINGYTILEDFKVVGAGLSKWTFAERGGRQFFIKEFLSPTYPDDAAPGSEKTKAKKRARCAVFERHHRGMQAALAPLSAYGGNLIVTLDFFRWGAKYYKVTEKVDAEPIDPAGIARLELRLQLVLLKSVAHSLKILHDLRIVHGDLKPSNILVKRTELGYTSKLIDFDSSYLVGHPPTPEEIVGTINYYSPELLGYIQEAGVTADQLGVASDVFALGLIFTEFLTGAPPPFDAATFHEPATAVRAGVVLRIPRTGIVPELAESDRRHAGRRSDPSADASPRCTRR